MTLIKSMSGIRGTIGGQIDKSLTPIDIVKYAASYGTWLKRNHTNKQLKVVIGRDARISGNMVSGLVINTLIGLGIDVIDLELSTTPTVEIAVPIEGAHGGIILTASHNPIQWNALKLLNEKGEFISGADGQEVLKIAEQNSYIFAEVLELGKVVKKDYYIDKHIELILALPLVDKAAIEQSDFSIVVDAVNSSGGIAVPKLLKALGVKNITELYCEPTGYFPHNPEPLPEHLTELSSKIKSSNAAIGITVDPDVDRLALVCEDGSMFGEEYTLVAVADYVLSKTPGVTVSNLSSTRALRDVTESYGMQYFASAVGEVNVVSKMKEHCAVIGGEGNGGIIYPVLHYGRDSLVGIALFLSHLAQKKVSMTELRSMYPNYVISKNKVELTDSIDVDHILSRISEIYANEEIDTIDGVKINFKEEWVHLRKSNTEPIIRIYSESKSEEKANQLAQEIIEKIQSLV